MNNNNKKTMHQAQFASVQSKLARIVSELGVQKGRNRRASVISAYLYLFNEITQKQLINLTGFSAGTISTVLNSYIEQGFVKKEFREDPSTKKPKYYYSVKGTFMSNLSTMMQQAGQFIPKIAQKLQEVKIKMSEPSLKNKQGYTNLATFSNEMSLYIKNYVDLMTKIQKNAARGKD